MGDHNTPKKAATESKNNTQYKPVLFLVVSIVIISCKYNKAELIISNFLLVLIVYILRKVVYCRFL